jgi:hypothetical protein
MTDRRSNAGPIAIAVLLLLLPCLYVGSYFALVQRDPSSLGTLVSFDIREGRCEVMERYRAGGSVARHFYAPANWADRRIRREYWLI